MGATGDETERAIKILNHPVRIKIIELLGSSGPLSWKELSSSLGTSTGSLYHHLDMLERIVARDPSKRYALTKLGEDVYRRMKENPSVIRNPDGIAGLVRRRTAASVVLGVFIPRGSIDALASNATRAVVVSAGVLALVFASLAFSRVQPLLLSISPAQSVVQSALGFGGSLAALIVVTYLFSLVAKSKAIPRTLLVTVSVAYVPLAVFALMVRELTAGGTTLLFGTTSVMTVLFVFFQGWSMAAFGAGVSVATGMRIEKTLVWSTLVLYASVMLMLLTGVRFV